MTKDLQRQGSLWVYIALAAAVMAVYWPVVHFEFVSFDDPVYVTGNEMVQAGLKPETVRWAFTTLEAQFWHPLTWLSHMLDCQIFGFKAGGHHLMNVLLHLVNTLLLFGLLRRMTGALWRSAMVAALFALHPLHVESVAWVAERKDILSTLFFILTLWAYTRYAENCKVRSSKSKVGTDSTSNRPFASPIPRQLSLYYGLALLFFALGLMAKPMLVTLPFVLLLLDYWPLRRIELPTHNFQRSTFMRLLWEKAPFFLLTIAACGLAFHAQKAGGKLLSMDQLSMSDRLGNALVSYVRYLGKTFWPSGLTVHYPHPGQWLGWQVTGALLLLAGVTLAAIWASRQRPYLAMGWFWFVGTLVPVIGLVQVGGHAMADRYTYVPLIGVFTLTVWGVADWCQEASAKWQGRKRPRISPVTRHSSLVTSALSAAAIIACVVCSRFQLVHWRNSLALFEHAVAVAPNNALVRNNLGVALLQLGHGAEAAEHLKEALRLKHDYADAHFNLGMALFQQGQVPDAIEQYEAALRSKPNLADAHNNLGVALFQQGRGPEAIAHYEQALRLNPRSADAHYNLGNALIGQGKLPEAAEHYQQAVRIKPDYAGAHKNLAVVLFEQGKVTEAVTHLEQAVRFNPQDGDAHFNLGKALAQLGRLTEAAAAFEQVLRLNPQDAQARAQLELVRSRLGGNIPPQANEISPAPGRR